MRPEHFRYLLEIDRLHSISAAARSLHIRQTTLSAAVRSVEDELGFPIFQRAPTGVVATPAGEQFMVLAWEISVKYEELLSLKKRTAEGAQAINVLLGPSVTPALPVPLMDRAARSGLRGDLVFETGESGAICERLGENAAGIGVTYLTGEQMERVRGANQKDQLVIEPLLRDRLFLLVSRSHRLAELDAVSMDQVAGERWASQKRTGDDPILGKAMLKCPRITTFLDVELLCRAVLEQDMIALLPGYTILSMEPERLAGYRMLPITGTEKENRLFLCLLHRREDELRYQEKLLAQCIQEHFLLFAGLHPELDPAGKEGTGV